jgi:hypothetical protein
MERTSLPARSTPDQPESSELSQLAAAVRDLQRRVTLLEQTGLERSALPGAEVPGVPAPAITEIAARAAMPDTVPAIGRAVLVLAGAYLLRALAESEVAPRLAVVAAALVYAGVWLVIAARQERSRASAGLVYSTTAVLVIAPLLWEATARFGVLPAAGTSVLLAALAGAAFWLGAAAWTTPVAAAVTSVALMIRTGDLLPFVLAALAAACVVEACRMPGVIRFGAAIAADCAIFLLIWIETRPEGLAPGYVAVNGPWIAACAIALPWIWLVSAVRRGRLGGLEIFQVAVALGLAIYGAPARASGVLAAVLCGCALLAWHYGIQRGLMLAITTALCLGAGFLLLPLSRAAVLWGVAGMAAAPIEDGAALVLLAAAAVAGGGLTGVEAGFAASHPLPNGFGTPLIALAAAICYWLSRRPWARIFHVGLAILGAGAWVLSNGPVSADLLPTVRTLFLCIAAIGATLAGARTKRADLKWAGYGFLGLSAVKLLAVDFHTSRAEFLAVALVSFGVTLIVLPRIRASL